MPAMIGPVVIAQCAASRTLHEVCSLSTERGRCHDVAPTQEEHIRVEFLEQLPGGKLRFYVTSSLREDAQLSPLTVKAANTCTNLDPERKPKRYSLLFH
jgi:hypothetical protein